MSNLMHNVVKLFIWWTFTWQSAVLLPPAQVHLHCAGHEADQSSWKLQYLCGTILMSKTPTLISLETIMVINRKYCSRLVKVFIINHWAVSRHCFHVVNYRTGHCGAGADSDERLTPATLKTPTPCVFISPSMDLRFHYNASSGKQLHQEEMRDLYLVKTIPLLLINSSCRFIYCFKWYKSTK